jgi:hypothetical protein
MHALPRQPEFLRNRLIGRPRPHGRNNRVIAIDALRDCAPHRCRGCLIPMIVLVTAPRAGSLALASSRIGWKYQITQALIGR